ncbi:hypothetical protein [Mycobacterium colombiense]|uniref:hypothetical protein n=1 Tax=Mycobacterium colombiense TaxID=339268 RepID=UPI0007EDB4C7|nr:hypothetical protein [Mycobacterium colombiense]OBJ06440.1 hypothetical protein A5623_06110 [Mycobacterium colombiense]
MDGDYDDPGPDNTLGPSESLDSDEVRNDDGDIVVDAPLRWISPKENLTLDKRLAAEEPEFGYTEEPPFLGVVGDDGQQSIVSTAFDTAHRRW